jgi:hypothetical protein
MRHGFKNKGKRRRRDRQVLQTTSQRAILWSNKRLFAALKYMVMISRSYDHVTKFRETLISWYIYKIWFSAIMRITGKLYICHQLKSIAVKMNTKHNISLILFCKFVALQNTAGGLT